MILTKDWPDCLPWPLAQVVIAAAIAWRVDVADGHERPDVTRVTYKFFHFMQVTRG